MVVSTLGFLLHGWCMGLCLWLALHLVEGGDNPPLLALAIGLGFAVVNADFGSLGLLALVALFVLLVRVYQMSMGPALLTCIVLGIIEFALLVMLASVLVGAGPLAALGLLVGVVGLSLYWWRHDLSLLGVWMRQRGEKTYAKTRARAEASAKQSHMPKAQVRPLRKQAAPEPKQPPDPTSSQSAPPPTRSPERVSLFDAPPDPVDDD